MVRPLQDALRRPNSRGMQRGRYLPQGDSVMKKLLLATVIVLSFPALAQTNAQTSVTAEPMSSTPTFRVTVISRSVQAVKHPHRSGSAERDFARTDLMNAANE